MNWKFRIRVAVLLFTVTVGASHLQAGIWSRFCCDGDRCEDRCEVQSQEVRECRPVKEKKKRRCCLVGDIPEVAPIVRTIAARTVTDAAVRVAPETNRPRLVTRIEPTTVDGSGVELDKANADSRLDGLESELEDMSILIRELSEQLKALEARENGS